MPDKGAETTVKGIVQRLRKLDSSAVSDALDRLKLGNTVVNIPQLSGEGRIAGRITTVKLGVGEGPEGPPRHLCTKAIEAGGADDVIVVEQRSGADAASWGGLLSLAAKMRKIAGVVCDGPVRDVDASKDYGFPVFARKVTAKTARGRIIELGTDVPVFLENLRVNPGDYLVADKSAVIIIAASDILPVLAAAEAIAAKEDAMAKALLEGQSAGKVMGGEYENMLKS
jgi:4-hydroxy-4-methyl-2-oxoglutarate aldolase